MIGARPKSGLVSQGLTLERFEWEGQRFAVLSFPLGKLPEAASLTAAERAVALAVLRGESNQEIARSRKTSPRTIANQIASVFKKLGARSRAELRLRCGAIADV